MKDDEIRRLYQEAIDAVPLQEWLEELLESSPFISVKFNEEGMDKTGFYVGQVIEDFGQKWVIRTLEGDKASFEVLGTNEDKPGCIGSYVDVGKTYTMERISNYPNYEIWEVNPAEMKRSTSQVLVYIWGHAPPSLDLDS